MYIYIGVYIYMYIYILDAYIGDSGTRQHANLRLRTDSSPPAPKPLRAQVQGYLAHKKQYPPWDHHKAPGIVLL